MRLSIDVLLSYYIRDPADVLLAVEAAVLPDQLVIEDRLTVRGTGPLTPIAGQDAIGRRTWAHATAGIRAEYSAIVEVERVVLPVIDLPGDPLPSLPANVTDYLFSSRYCDADLVEPWVERRFGALPGGAKVAAIIDWVRDEIAYVPGSSDARTTAADTLVSRRGVCRDFAHLAVAMIRAAGIPARVVGCYAPGVHPPDFHAVVEVWLAGGWHLVDPTGMATPESIVRIGVGRDATDISFLTTFGTASLIEQRVTVTAIQTGPTDPPA